MIRSVACNQNVIHEVSNNHCQELHSELVLRPWSRNLIKVRFVNLSASKSSVLKSTVEKSCQYSPLTLNRWRETFF